MTTLITGNTYPVREELKALGGQWNKYRKGWEVPSGNAEKAQALVSSSRPKSRRTNRADKYQSHIFRFASGEEAYVNKRGRCEDAPCCGCCS